MRPHPPRLTGRMMALVMLTAALLAMLVGGGLVYAVGERLIAVRQDAVARSARDHFVAFAHEEGLATLARALERSERAPVPGGFRYALYGDDGRLLGGADLLAASELPPAGVRDVQIGQGEEASEWRVLVQPIATGGTLVVFEDLAERAAFHRALLIGSLASFGAAIGAVAGVSLWLNQLLLNRAAAIERTAAEVSAGDLGARAPARADGDVFDRLALALNAMLERNEELMTGMRAVTDSLAHDLRTPLTRLRTALSEALRPGVEGEPRARLLERAWEEADRALATTSALLDVARAEAGVSREMFQPVDLREVVDGTAELFGPVLEDAGQTLEVETGGPVRIDGHELLLRQALGNLLHNAAKYAGEGARVRVGIEDAGPSVRLVVADDGPGVPEAARGRVQARFVRLDAARSTEGAGLGLAIAAACARLHGGVLRLEDNAPGLRAEMELRRAGSGQQGPAVRA